VSRRLIPFTRFTAGVFFVVCTFFFGEAKLTACGARVASRSATAVAAVAGDAVAGEYACVACMTCVALCEGGVASYGRVLIAFFFRTRGRTTWWTSWARSSTGIS